MDLTSQNLFAISESIQLDFIIWAFQLFKLENLHDKYLYEYFRENQLYFLWMLSRIPSSFPRKYLNKNNLLYLQCVSLIILVLCSLVVPPIRWEPGIEKLWLAISGVARSRSRRRSVWFESGDPIRPSKLPGITGHDKSLMNAELGLKFYMATNRTRVNRAKGKKFDPKPRLKILNIFE